MSAVESIVGRRPLAQPVPLERARVPRDTVALARHLLGKVLVRRFGTQLVTGRIVETEAYLQGDPACHAFRGMTARNRSLCLDVGHAYVYLCYGTSWMLNVSSEGCGTGEGVLLRALEPLSGIERMRQGRESVWQLEQRRLRDARHYLDLISKHWDEALGRLRKFVED